jgi:hypothetical protein
MFKLYFSFIFLAIIVLNRTKVSIATGTRQSFINTLYYDNLSIF